MIALLTAVAGGTWPSRDVPDPDGFSDAVETMRAMRRRIDGENATGDDRRRYRVAASTVERLSRALAARHRWPALAVDAIRLRALLGAIETVWPPEELPYLFEAGITGLRDLDDEHPLVRFLARAIGDGAGIVVSVQPILDRPIVELPGMNPAAAGPAQARPDLADAVVALHERLPLPFAGETGGRAEARHRQVRALRAQIAEALRRGDVVPVGMAAQHDVITEVLRELQDPGLPAGTVRIVHVDCSESAAFPIGAEVHGHAVSGRSLRLGLMSVRHMDADAGVAGYWFRNRLVSVAGRSIAETEAFCFRDTLARLPELTANGIGHIEMLHTGYEPAVIGFYRAVLEHDRRCRNEGPGAAGGDTALSAR